MKKVAILVAIIIVISAPLTVSAAVNALTIHPHLSFNGTTATCEVTVVGNDLSEYIVVEIRLMRGTACVDSWSTDGYGYVHWKDYVSVVKGQTYELEVAVTVDGISYTPVSQTGTC